jgi:NAD-dependent deacetylase
VTEERAAALSAGARKAAGLVDDAERVVVLTGAGISTDSGIPDFRGPNGLWTKNPSAEKSATLDVYLRDPEARRKAWQRHAGSPWTAEPNAGHRALVELERRGKLHALITQNIDSLHHRAGSDPEKIVEVHGNVREYVCMTCSDRGPMEDVVARVKAGEDDPRCESCGGILKSATISFGQSLVPEDLERADRAARSCDLILAVGTTLTVYPICDVVPIAAGTGAKVVIVNAEPTQYDFLGDVVLYEQISEVLPQIVGVGGNVD